MNDVGYFVDSCSIGAIAFAPAASNRSWGFTRGEKMSV
jgi:hypothetical protein